MLADTDLEVETILYMKNPPDRDALTQLVAQLQDNPTDLVRRDALFKKLEIDPDSLDSDEAVIDLLVERPKLLQRPVIVKGDKAIIGRPKSRLADWLAAN